MLFSKFVGLTALVALASAQDLLSLLNSTSNLSNLTSLVTQNPDVMAAVGGKTNITVLAPSNEAIEALSKEPNSQALLADISAILTYHVLDGIYLSSAIKTIGSFIPTLLTNQTFSLANDSQRVKVIKVNDKVQIFSAAGAMEANVIVADQNFTGGVLHIIDKVLVIPYNTSKTITSVNATLAWLAVNSTDKDLDKRNGMPNITVFVPNNGAINRVIGGRVSTYVKNLFSLNTADEDTLQGILNYHVVNGTVAYSSTLVNNSKVSTLNGTDLTIHIEANGDIFVNSAKVVTPDILMENGVVHIIDNVLNPANATAMPDLSASTDAPAFADAVSATSITVSGISSLPTMTETASTSTSKSSKGGAAAPMKTPPAAAAAGAGLGAAVLGWAVLAGL